ncbi:MAG: HAD family hydrolase [Oscillospiraceae bacterium]|nr:HAD family hydrolase [Oscillospiraceae bacterium]
MPIYKYLIFDVDDTLLDFYFAFATAQRNIAEKLGIEPSKEYFETDEKCGWKAWEESNLDKTEEKDVQENYHVYYYQYLRKHFEYLLETYGKAYDVQELVNCYLKSISSSRVMTEPDTLSIYMKLSERYKLVLATNGMERVQKERLFDFLPYTHRLYISEEIGYIKPMKEFYSYIIRDLKCKSDECIMIGDSVSNDIIGAKAIGMDVCYYNPKGKIKPENVLVDYEVNSIRNLVQILL